VVAPSIWPCPALERKKKAKRLARMEENIKIGSTERPAMGIRPGIRTGSSIDAIVTMKAKTENQIES